MVWSAGAFGVFAWKRSLPCRKSASPLLSIPTPDADALAQRWSQRLPQPRNDAVDPSVEIAVLNTPLPFLHGAQGLAVLEAGKHLFCEKPLALTLADGESLIRAVGGSTELALTVDYAASEPVLAGGCRAA
ncbi:MAG: Gfo/Idh/MocA family oxidoreductase [Anaerolineae bacterium]